MLLRTGSTALFAAVIMACVVAPTRKADATLITYICDDAACLGGNDTIVTDQGPGDNFPGSAMVGQVNAGAVNFAGFTIVTNTSQSKPLIGSAGIPQLDISFAVTTSDNAAHTIYLYASDTGFTYVGAGRLELGGTQPPSGDGNSLTAFAYGAASNTNFDRSNLLGSIGPDNTSPFALSASLPSGIPPVSPYSVTIGLKIDRASAGTTTGDLNVRAVPEPMSIALLGSGLLAAGLFRRKRP